MIINTDTTRYNTQLIKILILNSLFMSNGYFAFHVPLTITYKFVFDIESIFVKRNL